MLHSSRPGFPRVYAVRSSPTRSSAVPRSAAFPGRLPPPNPRALQHPSLQDVTYRRMGRGGHLRPGPRRIGCRTSDTRSPAQRRLKLADAAARSVAGESPLPRRPEQSKFEREGQRPPPASREGDGGDAGETGGHIFTHASCSPRCTS